MAQTVIPTADPTQATITAALTRLQHARGWLSAADLRDLARRLDVPLYKLEEVVSFFPHFRRSPPAPVEVDVCRDMTCHLRGAAELTARLRAVADGRTVRVNEVSCLGRCDRAPAVCLNRRAGHGDEVHDAFYLGRSPDDVENAVRTAASGAPVPPPDRDADRPLTCPDWTIDVYKGTATYAAAEHYQRLLRIVDDPTAARQGLDIIPKLKLSGLRGMGGAGAPAWKKWDDVARAAGDVKYIVANADESEPGTFKDREIMLRAPHLVVEGVILAGIACGATRGYIYIRHEYPEEADALRRAIAAAEEAGVCENFPVSVYVSPGGYICGEQSALIEAMEGKRAQPRNRPPELATNGLFDRPTLVNNVETFAWVPGIVLQTDLAGGVNWYGSLGPGNRGARLFSISGDVARPGVYELPIGAPVRELLRAAGGVVGSDDALKAIATSGPSGGFVPRRLRDPKDAAKSIDLLDVELDIDVFRGLRLALGAGIVVYGANADLAAAAANATEFFRNESCGKCVPCRVGSQKLTEIGTALLRGRATGGEQAVVRELDRALEQTSICGLGQVAAKPLATLLRYFPGDVPARK
jgi:NADH:ubiquinone oxidoreductase subunit F (NADH-binding)/NADH:ubiquinone oxidoreductase subunit E